MADGFSAEYEIYRQTRWELEHRYRGCRSARSREFVIQVPLKFAAFLKAEQPPIGRWA
jgi:hypothetical protein